MKEAYRIEELVAVIHEKVEAWKSQLDRGFDAFLNIADEFVELVLLGERGQAISQDWDWALIVAPPPA